jgi:hypothetical protein
MRLCLSGRQDLNLRPLGPQPSALPDCATPRGVLHSDESGYRCRVGTSHWPKLVQGNVCSPLWRCLNEEMRPLRQGEVLRGICLAAKSSGAAGQLLSAMSRGVQAQALSRQPPALHRDGAEAKEGLGRRTHRVCRRVPARASLRRLRGGRPGGPRVRPPQGQEVRHRPRPPRPRLAKRARRDCKVRRGLCKLSPSPHGTPGRLRTRGGSSTVEPRPSKAMMRVRFPSAALLPLPPARAVRGPGSPRGRGRRGCCRSRLRPRCWRGRRSPRRGRSP